jgi:hypothetical protein
MAWQSVGEECFQWAEKSAAQGEHDGFNKLGSCYKVGVECKRDAERAKEIFWLPLRLGMCTRWFPWGSCLSKAILDDVFGLDELLLGLLIPS